MNSLEKLDWKSIYGEKSGWMARAIDRGVEEE